VSAGYTWYQSAVETQALLIEAFHEIAADSLQLDAMKTWLLQQKQTQNWKTTRATADACYALLIQGTDWLAATPSVQIRAGDKTVNSSGQDQAGTGYFKKVFDGPFVNPSMGNITVTLAATYGHAGPAWGALYWQYFENPDKALSAVGSHSGLDLQKKLFREKNTDRGPLLELIRENETLNPGDKIRVRIILRADRNLEYVHMKDMRASCLEPVNVLSGYKWQGGLGYYETTQDASTSFFFPQLPKGTYVFEYPLFVTTTGNFSLGICSIQCMYAPEFTTRSEGIRVNVERP
jgi:hypothetical protein